MLASGRLGRQCHHSPAMRAEHDSRLDRHRSAEGMADEDEPASTRPARQIGDGGKVVHAARKVVGFAVADADVAIPWVAASSQPSVVVEAAGGTEQAAHPAATRHHDIARVAGAVPEHGEQPVQGVDLEVCEPGRDLDFFDDERLEQFEGRARFARSTTSTSAVPASAPRSSRSVDRRDELGDSCVGQGTRPFRDGRVVAHDGHIGRPFGALAIEHGPIRREEAVDLEVARRARVRRRRCRW